MDTDSHKYCHDNFCPTHGYQRRLAKAQYLKNNIQEDYPCLMVRVSPRAYLMDWSMRDLRRRILTPLWRHHPTYVWRWHWDYANPHLHVVYLGYTGRSQVALLRALCYEALHSLNLPRVGRDMVSVKEARTNAHACIDYIWEVNHDTDNPLPPVRCPPRGWRGRGWDCTQDIS